jgi:hypothetical protein
MNILIFNFLYLLHASKPRIHLQEDGCIYRHGIVRITCINIYNRLPEDEPSTSKHVEDIKIFKLKYKFRKGALCLFILYNYFTMHGAKT